jgi:cytochrome c556
MTQTCKLLLVVMGLTLAPFSMADGKVEANYRQAVMKSIGGHMSAMGNILKNQVHLDDMALHANGLAGLADIAPELFPAGSDVEKSKALPAVWEDAAGFEQAMNKFVEAAEGMAEASKYGEMSDIVPAIQALGGSCKGCHDDYKAE